MHVQHITRRLPLRLQPASKAEMHSMNGVLQLAYGWQLSQTVTLLRSACHCRDLGPAVSCVPAESIRPMDVGDFEVALRSIRPSVSREQLAAFADWTAQYGTLS